LFLIVLAPIAAALLQFAISRTREYSADLGSAEITGNPAALASALEKLEAMGHQIPMNGNPTMSPLLIVNPLSTKVCRLFSGLIHPTEDRIRRLFRIGEAKARHPSCGVTFRNLRRVECFQDPV
jgi:heat shock protein HtpX